MRNQDWLDLHSLKKRYSPTCVSMQNVKSNLAVFDTCHLWQVPPMTWLHINSVGMGPNCVRVANKKYFLKHFIVSFSWREYTWNTELKLGVFDWIWNVSKMLTSTRSDWLNKVSRLILVYKSALVGILSTLVGVSKIRVLCKIIFREWKFPCNLNCGGKCVFDTT